MRLALLALTLAGISAPAADSRFDRFGRDLTRIAGELQVSKISAAIVQDGSVRWRKDASVRGAPLDQSATGVRVMHLLDQGRISLDDPVGVPKNATVAQVLANTADGTPGEEYVYNTQFVDWVAQSVGALDPPSSLEDLIHYAIELDSTLLVSEKGKALMFAPVKSIDGVTLPRGLGWFSQEISGERVIWDFAQNEDASTLFVKIPARKLTLIVLANSKAMTEAPHLEDGNVLRSSIALAFLEDVVLDRPFARDEMENRAIQAFDLGHRDESAAILRNTLEKFPELESSDDLTLLRLASGLNFRATESIATVVIAKHPSLPPAWFYYGKFLERDKRYREAAACFGEITDHQPPWHNWTVGEAKKELTTLE